MDAAWSFLADTRMHVGVSYVYFMNYTKSTRHGSFVKKSTGYVMHLAAASSVRQGLYWLRRRLKLIGKETKITESLQLKLCAYSCVSMIMHSAQGRYYSSATQHVYPCWKQTCSILKHHFWKFSCTFARESKLTDDEHLAAECEEWITLFSDFYRQISVARAISHFRT